MAWPPLVCFVMALNSAKYTIQSIVCKASCHSVTQSFGHSVTRLLGHSVTQSLSYYVTMSFCHSVSTILHNWLTNTQHQDFQVCFADNNSYGHWDITWYQHKSSWKAEFCENLTFGILVNPEIEMLTKLIQMKRLWRREPPEFPPSTLHSLIV